MRMVRQKTQIKKIENLAARQVTFSKRRRGLFKKAQELSTLCDVDLALIVFSATGKLFHYSPLSMNQVLERHRLQSQNSGGSQQSSQDEIQVALRRSAMLSKELAEKRRELGQMKGEDLQGLDLKELSKLEAIIESRLVAVVKAKAEKISEDINTLKQKEAQMLEENAQLKKQLVMMEKSVGQRIIHGQCGHYHSLELTISISSLSSTDPSHKCNSSNSDTCLKLGQPFSD
uniref:MADS-box protein SVP-like n=1 Tax=Erigeron canadensis TaxID=72917 RepID=UPI001CB8D58A|nr:MADS-box protein SVP-like [Erigeron canadensis]XP_043617600.1 MADS-box protein SVP-like [Erigeron canadensis]XP_043617601.1 MADS-box protein SVP-like [Erigeron canadensis]XP_043617602.1 MADS-box protein SVP-like [Erigeron canadensis]